MVRSYISASSFYTLYKPSKCERRVYLAAAGVPGAEPSELSALIAELGDRHEKDHLASFPEYRDLSEGSSSDRAQRTREAVERKCPVIYQGYLRAPLPGSRDVVSGAPDFLISDGDSYRVRDCKLARRASEGSHPEIRRQLQTYGWLFEETFGRPPAALEAYLGDGRIEVIPYAGAGAIIKEISLLRDLSLLPEEPYVPVGWSKCSACTYFERCWAAAERSHDVSLVYGLDQATALTLREQGVSTYEELLSTFTSRSLSALERRRGNRVTRVGVKAAGMLRNARALSTGKALMAGKLRLPRSRLMVMFDLDGVPPRDEELEKVYLWGMQVYGKGTDAPYNPAVAGFGPEGDREGWLAFLSLAARIFAQHGDIPFVHWSPYEKGKLIAYEKRHGDPDGIAARVRKNCFDLLTAVLGAFALPVPSYSLKVIEGIAGFKRTMLQYGGDWSIARYIRAAQSDDPSLRREVMDTIMKYNQEDLRATWAVLEWARDLAGRLSGAGGARPAAAG